MKINLKFLGVVFILLVILIKKLPIANLITIKLLMMPKMTVKVVRYILLAILAQAVKFLIVNL